MKRDMTGPGLHGSIKNFANDTIKYKSYITDTDNFLLKYEDIRLNQLKDEYQFKWEHNFLNLSLDDVKSLIIYIELMS